MFAKIHEILSNIWVKLIAVIPICYFQVDNKEVIMISALLVIIAVDLVFGMAVAEWIKKNFDWGDLGKKISKKFLLYFFTLLASYVIAKSYPTAFSWWFYALGSTLVFSEFGSLMDKSKLLGLPVNIEYINLLNKRIDMLIKSFLGKKEKGGD